MLGAKVLKQRLRTDFAVGCIVSIPSADVTEVLAYAGFDFLFIDHEHGHGGLGDAVSQLRAMKETGTASLIRVPSSDATYIQRVLDAGVDCLYCPKVESAAEARRVVEACFFPPRGTRGAASGTRVSLYGKDARYYDRLSDDLLVVVAIESVAAVSQVEEIAAVPGIDVIFIGPRDISASLGKLNQFQDPQVIATVDECAARVLRSGKILGSTIYPGRAIPEMVQRGYRMLLAGSDVGFLQSGAATVLAGR